MTCNSRLHGGKFTQPHVSQTNGKTGTRLSPEEHPGLNLRSVTSGHIAIGSNNYISPTLA